MAKKGKKRLNHFRIHLKKAKKIDLTNRKNDFEKFKKVLENLKDSALIVRFDLKDLVMVQMDSIGGLVGDQQKGVLIFKNPENEKR